VGKKMEKKILEKKKGERNTKQQNAYATCSDALVHKRRKIAFYIFGWRGVFIDLVSHFR
jgi:hypothetical protein